MKRYFKREAESEIGVGIVYIEITDDWPSRQVEVYGETWRWGNEVHSSDLADQPFEELELGEEHAITKDEFEDVWNEALKRCPRSF